MANDTVINIGKKLEKVAEQQVSTAAELVNNSLNPMSHGERYAMSLPGKVVPQFGASKMLPEYLILDLYNAAFGYFGRPLYADELKQVQAAHEFDKQTEAEQSTASGARLKQYTGVTNNSYYLCPVLFKRAGYDDAVVIPYAMISVRATKKLVETAMIEAGGSVIEEIGIDNYQFTIRGMIVSDQEVPIDEIRTLVEFFKLGESISLINAISDLFLDDSDSVIIKELSLPDMQGTSNIQAFEISVISNKPFSLEL